MERIKIQALTLLLGSLSVSADNWPHWRGPNFDGSSKETGLPATFSKTENVKWVATMPGPAAATPIIWEDRVFISSVDASKRALVALCVDRKTGKELWRNEVAPGDKQDDKSNYASPSPVTDGKLVYFFYGNGELAAFDLDGKKAWARNLQKDYGSFAFLWTFSTSPTLYDGRLYMQVLQRDRVVNGRGKTGANDSYLLALDPKTGKELWRHVRPAEAREESLESFTTPIPFEFKGRKELLVAGGDCVSGHDLANGRELWRWGTWNPTRITHWRLVPSPVAGEGIVLVCAPKGSPVYGVRAGANGIVPDDGFAWKSTEREVSSDVSTPLFYNGRFYIVNSDRRTLSAVDPATGKVFWTGNLESRAKIEASPTGADGKIYVMNHRGDVFVAKAGDNFEILHQTPFGEEGDRDLRSTIPVSQGQLFVRTGSKLYCIAN
jgi:outer membrane protein assembly factor BamB